MALTSTSLSRQICPDVIQVDRGTASENVDTEISVTDNNGCAVDLSEIPGYTDPDTIPPDPLPEPPDPPWEPPVKDPTKLPKGIYATYIAKPSYDSDFSTIRVPLEAIDASKGKFRLKFLRKQTRPGIYLAEVNIHDSKDTLYLRDRRFLELLPTVRYVNHGPLTELEVRMRMRDFECLNTLLKHEEMYPSEIMLAIRGAVDLWNAQPPVGVAIYNTANFPHQLRGGWMEGVICLLLDSHGMWRRRNYMTIQNSTITVQKNDNWQSYLQDSVVRKRDWLAWVQATKRSINLGMGFGYLPSHYARIF